MRGRGPSCPDIGLSPTHSLICSFSLLFLLFSWLWTLPSSGPSPQFSLKLIPLAPLCQPCHSVTSALLLNSWFGVWSCHSLKGRVSQGRPNCSEWNKWEVRRWKQRSSHCYFFFSFLLEKVTALQRSFVLKGSREREARNLPADAEHYANSVMWSRFSYPRGAFYLHSESGAACLLTKFTKKQMNFRYILST